MRRLGIVPGLFYIWSMIQYFMPYSLNKNLAEAYNESMALLPNDDDWGCLMDGDTMFLTPDYGHIIHQATIKYANAGIITCMTNRVGDKRVCHNNQISTVHDYLEHEKIARYRKDKHGLAIQKIGAPISGHMMLVKKSTWNEVKFKGKGILGIDNRFSKDVQASGRRIIVLLGLYIYHNYRLVKGQASKEHILV